MVIGIATVGFSLVTLTTSTAPGGGCLEICISAHSSAAETRESLVPSKSASDPTEPATLALLSAQVNGDAAKDDEKKILLRRLCPFVAFTSQLSQLAGTIAVKLPEVITRARGALWFVHSNFPAVVANVPAVLPPSTGGDSGAPTGVSGVFATALTENVSTPFNSDVVTDLNLAAAAATFAVDRSDAVLVEA